MPNILLYILMINRRMGRFPADTAKERGPAGASTGRNAETDQVLEGISEGFDLPESGRVAQRGKAVFSSEPLFGSFECLIDSCC